MLYNRVVYDLASIVKLVVDKVSPPDRYQALALLKNIKEYLHNCDVPSTAVFDEPLITINKLIHTIDDLNIIKLSSSQGVPKSSKGITSKSLETSANAISTPSRPPVSRIAAVKRAPPSYESDDNDQVAEENEYASEGEQQLVQEEVVGEDTDWQPIDMLERALTVIANEQNKTSYVFEGNTEGSYMETPKSVRKKIIKKDKGAKILKSTEPKLYLPEDVEFSNPTPRTVAREGDRKWPENAQWICVYCRLIIKNLHNYKAHLRFQHRNEEPCCCRFCKRECANVELFNFHLCKEKHQCHVCLRTFNRPHKLRRHLGTHFKSVMVMVKCKICDQRFSSASSCAEHVYDEHETVIYCDSCVSEMDPHEVTPSDLARVYCLKCLQAANGKEPDAVPLNPNADMAITNTRMNAFDKGDAHVNHSKRHCDICNEDVLGGKAAWARHTSMARHVKAAAQQSGEDCPGFACSTCGKSFVSQERLKKHSRVHMEWYVARNTFTCKRCGKKLMTRGGYRNHIASHLGDRQFRCHECGKTFFSSSTLCDHVNSLHRPDLTYPCTVCGEEFQDRKRRTRHMNMVHHNYVYQCPVCDFVVRNASQLKTHIQSAHIDLVWTQPIDYRQRSNEPLPKKQRMSTTPDSGDPFSWTCDVCRVEMRTLLGKQRHLTSSMHLLKVAKATGSEAEKFECDECGKRFLSLKYLAHHTERIHNENGKRYDCDLCDKQFATPGGLKNHKVKHTGIRAFECDYCHMSFFVRSGLSDHLASVHGKSERDYPCRKCNKVFKDRKQRTKHVDRDHHNYIFQCPSCDYEDKLSANLKRHIQTCHVSEVWTRPADYRYDDDEKYEMANASENNDDDDEEEEEEEGEISEKSEGSNKSSKELNELKDIQVHETSTARPYVSLLKISPKTPPSTSDGQVTTSKPEADDASKEKTNLDENSGDNDSISAVTVSQITVEEKKE
ncbi:zinc finger protein 699-like [Watersipora subatra]|uniref:zinc finger protein 699-like n=1 Tax=Watersipora subatra TaxID=2589382 RepID=UPI00355C927F